MPRRPSPRAAPSPSPVQITLKVNGAQYTHSVEPRLLLVHYLRSILGLTGTHVGCDTSHCGACTVLIRGPGEATWRAVKSCTMLAAQADGMEVLTIEGLAKNGELHPLQRAFWENHGLQCGFCTPGMIMAALGLLMRNPSPTREEIKWGISGNLCRCTGYINIIKSIEQAAKEMKEKSITL
ncbi:MAG: (2Fe-2S)-binding protein [Candidatus Caldarchaeales archaeon]|nr:(2Fe-2S)-binding protein [Candidatus Caldarchaeales archaeon]MDT7915117.1 (2Fe-2S)-binding protein [Candidatus Caldarchaeales archaeon]